MFFERDLQTRAFYKVITVVITLNYYLTCTSLQMILAAQRLGQMGRNELAGHNNNNNNNNIIQKVYNWTIPKIHYAAALEYKARTHIVSYVRVWLFR